LVLPIIPNKWTWLIALDDYSNINFRRESETEISDQVTELKRIEGKGGLNSVIFSNGFKVAPNLMAGVKLSYVFGIASYETRILPTSETIPFYYMTSVIEEVQYNGLLSNLGLYYKRKAGKEKRINTGLTVGLPNKINASLNKDFKRFRSLGNLDDFALVSILNDTISLAEETGEVNLPLDLGLGISYEKIFQYTVALDVRFKQWNSYRGVINPNERLSNSVRVGLGGEWIPDYSSVNSYFKRVIYRGGLYYEATPIKILDRRINDFGASLGAIFPIRTNFAINLAAAYGIQGTRDDGLIRENYFRLNFGCTFKDKWFQRSKFN